MQGFRFSSLIALNNAEWLVICSTKGDTGPYGYSMSYPIIQMKVLNRVDLFFYDKPRIHFNLSLEPAQLFAFCLLLFLFLLFFFLTGSAMFVAL